MTTACVLNMSELIEVCATKNQMKLEKLISERYNKKCSNKSKDQSKNK